jgi:septal ring factor EnvC (AmiA/AmiB activator)
MGRLSETLKRFSVPLDQQQRREVAALDEQFSEMETQIQRLETQNLKLKAQVNPLERQVERLQQRLEEQAEENKPKLIKIHLDETEDEIIELLAKSPPGLTILAIATTLEISTTRTEVLLRRLIEQQLVSTTRSWQGALYFRLDALGQEYAVKKGFA